MHPLTLPPFLPTSFLFTDSVDGSGCLRHFHNLASWFGRTYFGYNPGNPIDIDTLKKKIVDIVEGILINSY